ncbi:MAG: hypothetical protein KGJ72_09945 [Gammaproteobacteria bacterium]|nr:hypothetical protein [Gammaproteobacteria bacterium]
MRGSVVALAAAALLCCAVLASRPARAVDARAVWSDLWRTPDQQGQALLAGGQPAQAALRFHDPRRRAYAEIEAGRYGEAAQLLAPFNDARSQYNRGNALARTGQLQAALAAYDAALKQAPGDRDTRHNRELVERALRQQQQSSPSPSRNGQQGGRGAGSSGQQQQAGAGQRNGSAARQSGSAGSQSGGGQAASNGSRGGAGRAGNSGQQQPGGGGIQPGSGGPQAAGASGSGGSKEAPGQAQRDAAEAAAFARERQQRGAAGNMSQGKGSQRNGAAQGPDSGLLAGGTQTPKQQPESERQLALDQWLRQIPDSPAGLLQRKFLIEHMMRQQDDDEPQGGGP